MYFCVFLSVCLSVFVCLSCYLCPLWPSKIKKNIQLDMSIRFVYTEMIGVGLEKPEYTEIATQQTSL